MEYIYVNNNSLSKEICKDIINKFELEKNKIEGITSSGLNKDIKDSLDFDIRNSNSDEWSEILNLLDKELSKNVKKYVSNINEKLDVVSENSTAKFKYFSSQEITYDTYQIQKYKKNVGRYVYHHDEHIKWDERKKRVLTYLWYLNDVEEGGETNIWYDYKVIPKSGKLLIFPTTWTYPHRGKIPISSDKYILTGWIYATDK